MAKTILLVDDHQMLLEGIRELLAAAPDFDVVGRARSGREAMELAAKLQPHVVVMDITMPELNGIDATRKIMTDLPDTKLIGLSMHAERRLIEEMFKAGASGYVLKDAAFEELANAINTVLAGNTYLSPRLAAMAGNGEHASGLSSVFNALTNREREVLQLMSDGRSTKQIAMDLSVSVKTVETHRRQLMSKLDMYSVAELTKYAIRQGLTTADA